MIRKHILLFLFITFSNLIVWSQAGRQINTKDELGRKQGYWKSYDQMGHLRYEGNFKDDIPVDTFRYYYPDGRIRAISNIFNEGKESRTRLFHRNGKLMAEGKYLNRKKDSLWKYYSEYDGVLLKEENYKENLKEGLWRKFYPNGQPAEITYYAQDKEEGEWLQYFTDGTLKLRGFYETGKKHGGFKVYHANGKIQVQGTYKNSLKTGVWEYFTEEGGKLKEEKFINGKLISTQDF